MDLEQLRAINWYKIWRQVAVEEKQVTSLADQVWSHKDWCRDELVYTM